MTFLTNDPKGCGIAGIGTVIIAEEGGGVIGGSDREGTDAGLPVLALLFLRKSLVVDLLLPEEVEVD